MNLQDFCSQLDDLFELDPGTISPAHEFQQIPGWSSLTFMSLIALVDEEYSVMLRPAAVLQSRTVSELATLIDADGQLHSKAA